MIDEKERWPNTSITKHLNISLPFIQAPMAGNATTPELVANVCNAGGLGSLGAGYMMPDDMKKTIKKIKSLTNKPFAVNLFIPEEHHATPQEIADARIAIQESCTELNINIDNITPPYTPSFNEQLQIIIEEEIPIFSFTFGIPPKKWIKKLKEKNIILIGTATTVSEGIQLQEHGIDMIAAQGSEAGGHRGTFPKTTENALIETNALVKQLARHVKIPIIAAGGIMNAKDVLSAFSSGASAVQMGTAFLCCTESGAHPLYKKALINSDGDNTILTRAFSGKWARGLMNQFIARMQQHEKDILPYPIQHSLTKNMRKEAEKQNNIEFLSMWAGQKSYLCKESTAGQLINELNNDITILMNNLNKN